MAHKINVNAQMLLRAIISQHTVGGMTNAYAVAEDAYRLARSSHSGEFEPGKSRKRIGPNAK